jgi:hypothetical protein
VDGEDEAAGVVDEGVVDAPGVDADGGERRAAREKGDGFAESGLDLVPETADIPVVVRAEGAERIRKAVRFGEREFVFDQAPRMTRPLVAPRSTAAQKVVLAEGMRCRSVIVGFI